MNRRYKIKEVLSPKAINQNTQIEAQKSFERSSIGSKVTFGGTFGKVIKSYDDMTVDVELTSGIILKRVQVPSKNYVSSDPAIGGKDLPQKGSKVLVAFPDGSIEQAVIITSYFSQVDPRQKDFFPEGEYRKTKIVEEGGWTKAYDKETGNYLIESDDGVTVDIDKENQEIIINDWHNNNLTLNSNGVTITDTNGNIVSMEAGKVVVNGNFEVLQ